MKILSATQIREWDVYTIKSEPISSLDLMEKAATKCAAWIDEKFPKETHCAIYCGTGNNGGDGLVIGRLLSQNGYSVELFVLGDGKESECFKTNHKRLKEVQLNPIEIKGKNWVKPKNRPSLVIDCVFGSGLNRPLDGDYAFYVDQINRLKAFILAIDIPSGLFAESNKGNDLKYIVKADCTLTFQRPKLAFMLTDNYPYVGEWIVLDIGLSPDFEREQVSPYHYMLTADIKPLLKPRKRFAHKGDFGKALLIGGSKGMMGAVVMSARAALRSGVGLLTAFVPSSANSILQTSVPELMLKFSDHPDLVEGRLKEYNYDAIGVGPGLGKEKEVEGMLKQLIQEYSGSLVVDADALNILAEHKTWMAFLTPNTILTPHPGEFDRLYGGKLNSEERLEQQIQLSIKHNIIIVLKGANTSISTPSGKVFFNSSGNPGMARGGSGDALTGVLTSLLAQGYDPVDAAILGVYIHGLAGDIAKDKLGEHGMTTTDIIECLSFAFKTLSTNQ